MAQDVGQQGYEAEDTEERDPRNRSSVWPWILLAIVVLVVILLLWLYWRRPQQASVTVINKTVEIPVVVPEPRPEPVVPAVVASSTEASTVPLVPDVLGDPRISAIRTLEGAGYAVTTSDVRTATKTSGLVVGQNPAGGAPLERGGTVAIVLSAGTPATRDVRMPETVGLTQAAAESKVEAAGLVPYLTYGDTGHKEGYVISQWPLAGVLVPAGSEGFIQIQLRP
jgi:hypothetical protein